MIPPEERRKAQFVEGDKVEVRASGRGFLLMREIPRIEEVREKLSDKLAQ